MAIARQLDVRLGDGVIVAPNRNQENYVAWVNFIRYCASNGLCTVVASQYGSGGTGEDFHDQANPAGENAFIYAEWDSGVLRFGVLVQWADLSAWGASPGDPGLLDASSATDGVGIQMAFREDGLSPWNGTTNDDGADTKGTPVWIPGGSTVHVFPRSNNPGPPAGNHNTNKENCTRGGADLVAPNFTRAHWTANEDGIFYLHDDNDDGLYTAGYMGRYVIRTGLSALTFPYCMINRQDTVGFWPGASGTLWGDTGGFDNEQGGIVGIPADGVMSAAINFPNSGAHDSVYQPNNLISPNEFEAGRIAIFQRESVGGTLGLAGYLPSEMVTHIYNTANHNTNAAATLAYIGENTIAARKWVISWDGGAVPGTNNTRTGRQSFTP